MNHGRINYHKIENDGNDYHSENDIWIILVAAVCWNQHVSERNLDWKSCAKPFFAQRKTKMPISRVGGGT